MKNDFNTPIMSIVLMAISAIFSAAGQITYKFAGNRLDGTIMSFILNPFVYIGVIIFGIGFVFLLKALLKGEVTILYPIMSTSFIWIALLSPIIFGESMGWNKWLGIGVIILGVYFIARGRNE